MKKELVIVLGLFLVFAFLVSGTNTLTNVVNINGTLVDSKMGYALAVGDYNNDSVEDLLVGSNNDANVTLYFGVDTVGIVGRDYNTPNITFLSPVRGASFGYAVAMADFNNDSADDVIIAERDYDEDSGGAPEGRVMVFYGQSDVVTGMNLTVDHANVTIKGNESGGGADGLARGFDHLDVGDLNNDTIEDIVVSDSNRDIDGDGMTIEGQVYAFFGYDDLRNNYNMSVYDHPNITINGTPGLGGEYFGSSLAIIDDTSGDGADDLLVGAYLSDPAGGGANMNGMVYLFFGNISEGYNIDSVDYNVSFNGSFALGLTGEMVAGGDFNNDSLSEIVVSSYNFGDAGMVSMWYSSPNWLTHGTSYNIDSTVPNHNVSINGSWGLGGMFGQETLGLSRIRVEDINNDSIDDLIIGSYQSRGLYDYYGLTNNLGAVYVLYGNTDNSSMHINAAQTNLTLSGKYTNPDDRDFFGDNFVRWDDNNDSTYGLVVGAYQANNSGVTYSGQVYFYNWSDDITVPEVTISAPVNLYNSSSDFIVNVTANDTFNRIKTLVYAIYNVTGTQVFVENFTTIGLSNNVHFNMWNGTLDLSGYSEGNYNLTVLAFDEAGNLNETNNLSFTYDHTAPEYLEVVPNQTSGGSGDFYELNYTGTGTYAGIDQVKFYLQRTDENNNLTLNCSGNMTDYNVTWDSTGYETGTYFFDIWANDSAGNEREIDNYFTIVLAPSGVTVAQYLNNSLNLTANVTTTINDVANSGVSLDLIVTDNVNDSSVSINSYTSNLENSTSGFGVLSLGKFFSIVVSNATNANLSSSTLIKVYYTQALVDALGIDESTLILYKFNPTTGQWQSLPTTVSVAGNFLQANIDSFSSFGVAGRAPTTVATSSNAGGGGSDFVKSGEVVDIGELTLEGVTYNLYQDSILQFTLGSVVHMIDVGDIYFDANDVLFVNLKISSAMQEYDLKLGDIVSVDLDEDSRDDIELNVVDLKGMFAKVNIKALHKEGVKETVEESGGVISDLGEKVSAIDKEVFSKKRYWLPLSIVVGFLVMGLLYLGYKNRHEVGSLKLKKR